MIMKGQQYYNEYIERFKSYSDEELIDCFNRDVGNPGWVSACASFLAAIHSEFDRRNIDYSDIGDSKSLSLKHKVYLKEGKLFVIES
jgi:hypothetical protein